MTKEFLAQANIAQKNIDDINNILDSIKRIKLTDNHKRNRSPFLRFVNALKLKGGKEVREATVYLFDGTNYCGTEVPVDERLLDCLKAHYQERLEEAKAALDAM